MSRFVALSVWTDRVTGCGGVIQAQGMDELVNGTRGTSPSEHHGVLRPRVHTLPDHRPAHAHTTEHMALGHSKLEWVIIFSTNKD